MDINQLKAEYESAQEGRHLSDGERVKRNLDFVKALLSDNSPETMDYHYGLLKHRENRNLYHQIRAAFKRRPQAEEFLLKKLPAETNAATLGDILHLLGGLRSARAISLARQLVNSNDDYQREVALYVLGWVGNESDITVLNNRLINESSSRLRITAASAHCQIYYRLPDLKNRLLVSLKLGFENEEDDEVFAWIIVMIQSISGKRFGLREDKEDPNIIHGDVKKAKEKTLKVLSEFDR